MIPILITWGFDKMTGEIYLSCWLDCSKPENAKEVRMVSVRAIYTGENISLLRLEEGMTRGDVEAWITEPSLRKEVLSKLNKAKVRETDIVRKIHEGGNVMDYILAD
jgi:hypothetical protein